MNELSTFRDGLGFAQSMAQANGFNQKNGAGIRLATINGSLEP
jgi:hypothetical protein